MHYVKFKATQERINLNFKIPNSFYSQTDVSYFEDLKELEIWQ